MNTIKNGYPPKGHPASPPSSIDSSGKEESEPAKTTIPTPLLNLSLTRITEDTDVPPVEPTISIKESIFAVKGDISFISGVPKSGKSTLSRYMLATAIVEHIPNTMQTLGIRASYCQGRPVVYIDTEQPRSYTKRMALEIKRIVDNGRLPNNLYLYNWRHHTYAENRRAIEQLMGELPDTAYWVIDGVTDFVVGANDEKESNETIRFFMGVASKLDTTIVLLIHENAGNGKLRGHIGSEAERKCGGAITVRKDKQNGVHWIESKYSRGSTDFEKYAFYFDKEHQRFMLNDDVDTKNLISQQAQHAGQIAELHRLASLVFGNTDRLLKSQIVQALKTIVPPKPGQKPDAHRKAVDRKFREMVDEHNILTPFGEAKNVFHYLRPH